MIKNIYNRICRIVSIQQAQSIDGRKDFEDAERIFRYLTKYYEERD